MKRREHRELLMSGDLRRGKLEVSPLVAPLVLSFSPSCLCLYIYPFRDLDFIPMHTCFAWCLVLFLRLLLLLAIFLDSCLFLCQPCSYDLINIPFAGVVFVLFLFLPVSVSP